MQLDQLQQILESLEPLTFQADAQWQPFGAGIAIDGTNYSIAIVPRDKDDNYPFRISLLRRDKSLVLPMQNRPPPLVLDSINVEHPDDYDDDEWKSASNDIIALYEDAKRQIVNAALNQLLSELVPRSSEDQEGSS